MNNQELELKVKEILAVENFFDMTIAAVEFEKEYNARKFNSWHKWKKTDSVANIKLPDIDAITKNTLIYIVNAYPELAEQYLDFLGTLEIDFDGVATDLNLDKLAAEKYIVSLKLQRYLDRLTLTKKALTARLLDGDETVREEIDKIDINIKSASEKLEKLISI